MANYRRAFAQNHYIFITVVTFNRNPILIKNINLLRNSFKNASKTHSFEIYAAVILPEHFHIIIKPKLISAYPLIIKTIKQNFSKNIDYKYIEPIKPFFTQSMIQRKESGVWQRRFYEHTIRDEKDLYNHLDYIHFNPVKHKLVASVKDWEYSTFKKFVEKDFYNINWGNFDKTEGFQDLNLD